VLFQEAPAPLPLSRVSRLARPTAASVQQSVGELGASFLAVGLDGSILSRTATATASGKFAEYEDYVRRRPRAKPLSSVIARVATTATATAAEAEEGVATHAPPSPPPPPLPSVSQLEPAVYHQQIPTAQHQLYSPSSLLYSGTGLPLPQRSAGTTNGRQIDMPGLAGPTPMFSLTERMAETASSKAAEAAEGIATRAPPPPPPPPLPPVPQLKPAVIHPQSIPTTQHQLYPSSSMLSTIGSASGLLPFQQRSTGTTKGRRIDMPDLAGPPAMFSLTARRAATASSKAAEAEGGIATHATPPPPPLPPRADSRTNVSFGAWSAVCTAAGLPVQQESTDTSRRKQIGGRGPPAAPTVALAKTDVDRLAVGFGSRMPFSGAVKESGPPATSTAIQRESTADVEDGVYEFSAPGSLTALHQQVPVGFACGAVAPTAAYSASDHSSTSVVTDIDKTVEREIRPVLFDDAVQDRSDLLRDRSADYNSVRPLDGSTVTVPMRSHQFTAVQAHADVDGHAEVSEFTMQMPSPPASLERAEAVLGKELELADAAADEWQHPIAFGASDGALQMMFGSTFSSQDEVLESSAELSATEMPRPQPARELQASVVADSSAPVMKGTEESGFICRGPPVTLASKKKDDFNIATSRSRMKKRMKWRFDQITESERVPTPEFVAVHSGERSAAVARMSPARSAVADVPLARSVVADSSSSETMDESASREDWARSCSFVPRFVLSSIAREQMSTSYTRAGIPLISGGGPSKEQRRSVPSAREEEQGTDLLLARHHNRYYRKPLSVSPSVDSLGQYSYLLW